ncbi:Odorant receptor 349 [Nylanderia fulva]|uniref:Odorant receptor 349 n=1 Tax=Nylanderia fulva TaxID=613905 RepID=A0A6G1LPS9_9HYME|nr:Odorant receptor 349 [Nylanderia fulva]
MEYVENYFKLNQLLLLVSGIWPYQSKWSAYLMRVIYIALIIMVVIFQFKELFEHMWKDWALQKTDEEIKVMHEHAKTVRKFTFYYIFLAYGFLSMYIIYISMPEILDVISPINESRPRRQPFDYTYFIDEEKYFYVIRFCMFSLCYIIPSIYLISCTMFMAFTQHVCAMYKILGYHAEHLFYGSPSENDLKHGVRMRCKDIAIFVRLHYSILQFVDTLETCHTISFLLDLVTCICGLSITLTQIPNMIGDMEVAIRSISLTGSMLAYLYVYNYMGQKITDMSLGINEKFHFGTELIIDNNETMPSSVFLTACKFYIMSVQSFGMVIQTAVSYCMFLKQM